MSAEPDKQEPSYEKKIIEINGKNAIRRLCQLQRNYNPSEIEIERKFKKLYKYLEDSYGSIANVRLYSKGMSLQPIVVEAVNHLFGKKWWELNTVSDISNKITQCSQNDRLEIIFSLRAFLFDIPTLYWFDFSYSDDFEKSICSYQNLSLFDIKKFNENNIKKINVKPIELFLLPKNKKLQLINLIEEIFEDLNIIVIFDKLRVNPFYNDDLFDFILNHKEMFSPKTFQIYKNRNEYSKKLLEEADIQNQM